MPRQTANRQVVGNTILFAVINFRFLRDSDKPFTQVSVVELPVIVNCILEGCVELFAKIRIKRANVLSGRVLSSAEFLTRLREGFTVFLPLGQWATYLL